MLGHSDDAHGRGQEPLWLGGGKILPWIFRVGLF